MPLPAGVTVAAVTFGKAMSFLGVEASISGTVTADRSIVHAATGWSIHSADDAVAVVTGAEATFDVPHVDQNGFLDYVSGTPVKFWTYTFAGVIRFPSGQSKSFSKTFQVTVGQTTLDLDLTGTGALTPTAAKPLWLDAGNAVGVGSPEGVVAAPVGNRYVDTAATNGAIEWIKVTGTGNTGWQVVYGETGWRDISSLLINGWTGTVLVNRSTVGGLTYRMVDMSGANASGAILLAPPVGFRTTATGTGQVQRPRTLVSTTSGTVVTRASSMIAGSLQITGAVGTPDLVSGDLIAGPAVTPPWPIALPGVAV